MWALLVVLAYLPYAEALHDLFHYQLVGFAAEVTVVPTLAIFVIFVAIGLFRKPVIFLYGLLFLLFMAIVLIVRYLWGLDLSINDTMRQAVGLRYMLLVPTYIVVAGYVLQRASARRLATGIIMVNGAVAALVSVFYIAGLTVYRIIPEGSEIDSLYGIGEAGRAAGLSAGVNVYSNFLLLALVVSCLVYQRSTFIRAVSIFVLFLGMLASQSRWPLTSSVLVIGSMFLLYEQSGNKKRLLMVVFGVVLALSLTYFVTDSTSSLMGGVRGRLSQEMGEDIGVRQSKYEIGLNAIFESTYTVLAGASPENLIQGYRQEYIFSDNGILSMFITAGVPMSLAFVFFCYWFGRTFAPNRRTLRLYVFGAVALGVVFFNNAIYWDSWLFHAAVACFLISHAQVGPDFETALQWDEENEIQRSGRHLAKMQS
jgi:hypothetical protein